MIYQEIDPQNLGFKVHEEDPSEVFELLNLLGRGSFGAVYKARNRLTSDIVAVKMICLEAAEEGLDDVRKEINILTECDHPNIVKYYGSYYSHGDENLWITMEYCGGGSVGDMIQLMEKPLSEDQIALVCRESLKGLSYLHGMKKIHRDVKGGNILLNDKGEVKLADFGVSAQLMSTVSKRNTFVGTPYWMAPEVIQETKYDGKADVWSLGITAVELAEVLPPLNSIHPMRVLFMIPRNPPPKLQEPSKWTPTFHDFLSKSLVKDPKTRPTAANMLLHKFVSHCKPASVLVDTIDEFKTLAEQSKEYEPGADSDEEDTMGTVVRSDAQIARVGASPPEAPDGVMRRTPSSAEVASVSADMGVSVNEDFGTVRTSRKSTPSSTPRGSAEVPDTRLDATIRLPFIGLDELPMSAILNPDPSACDFRSTFSRLSGAEGCEGLSFSSTVFELTPSLGNVALAYAYEQEQVDSDSLPPSPSQAERCSRNAAELGLALKTILKI